MEGRMHWSAGAFHLPICFPEIRFWLQILEVNSYSPVKSSLEHVVKPPLRWMAGESQSLRGQNQRHDWSCCGQGTTLPRWLFLGTTEDSKVQGLLRHRSTGWESLLPDLKGVLPPDLRFQIKPYALQKAWFPKEIKTIFPKQKERDAWMSQATDVDADSYAVYHS